MTTNTSFKSNISSSLVILVVLITVSPPAQAIAEWYWITIPNDPTIGEFTELSALQYATTPIAKEQLYLIPNTLIEMWKKTDITSTCSGERSSATEKMRTFDATHEFYKQMCFDSEIRGHQDCGPVVNPETIAARASLLKTMETSANSCLKKIEDEKLKQEEVEHLAKIEEAIKNCDFDFFSNVMTDAERMKSYAEREACKTKTVAVTEPVVTKPAQVFPPKQEVVPPTKPATVPSAAPTQNNLTPVETKINLIDELQSSTEATTTETVSEESLEETDQDVVEPLQTDASQAEPSFFKKVTNFLKRLFSW